MKILPSCCYVTTGMISLLMAYKSLFTPHFLPFHEQAAGTSWDTLDKGVQSVILALMKFSGLGFLTVALLLLITPILQFLRCNPVLLYLLPGISFLFCFGLFFINYSLAVKRHAKTPWRGSLAAMLVIGIGILISFIQQGK
jgi:hypothetical protein